MRQSLSMGCVELCKCSGSARVALLAVACVLVSAGAATQASAGMGGTAGGAKPPAGVGNPAFFTPAQTQGSLSDLAPPKLNGVPITLDSRPDGQYSRIWKTLREERIAYDRAKAKATAVPLPSAAVGGLVLLCGLGVGRFVRRRPMA